MSDHPHTAVECGAESRYGSCLVFEENKVPYVIWFEDALAYYEVPTVVFDLYILVSNIDIAGDYLIKAGWTVDTESRHRIGIAKVEIPQLPLMSPDKETKTVLLLASDWKFPLKADSLERALWPNHPLHQKLAFPSLSDLLDALIESWLDGPSDDATLLIHLACQFNYLYEYSPALKERSFAQQLKYEHRQFHFDVLAGMESSTMVFRHHEQEIRDALLHDRYELQECSAPRDNEDLFDVWAKIRLPEPAANQPTV